MTRKIDLNYVPPVSLSKQPGTNRSNKTENLEKESFQEVLKKAGGVKFSGHALARLKERNIFLGQKEMEKITEALNLADKKGAREALLICENAALIASVERRTVITVVDEENLKERVFTNIDSAVIIK